MAERKSLIPEHNAACERAGGLSCSCPCRSAGHQVDLVTRAVSCSAEEEFTFLRADLMTVYGGYRDKIRDGSVRARRKVPKDLGSCRLDVGRGASWSEQIGLDEVLRSVFEGVARKAVSATCVQRSARRQLVLKLAACGVKGAPKKALKAHADAHVWCSVLAFVNAGAPSAESKNFDEKFAAICYPRNQRPVYPACALSLLSNYVERVSGLVAETRLEVKDLGWALHLYGAACCPDLWRHPGAVRFSLMPLVDAGLMSRGAVQAEVVDGFTDACRRWRSRENW